MISVFSGIRKRGGIAGTRQLSVDSMGISWNELRQKRHNLLESLKDDVDVMLNDLCVKRNVRYNSIGISRNRKSVMCAPTLKTPGPVKRTRKRLSSLSSMTTRSSEQHSEPEQVARRPTTPSPIHTTPPPVNNERLVLTLSPVDIRVTPPSNNEPILSTPSPIRTTPVPSNNEPILSTPSPMAITPPNNECIIITPSPIPTSNNEPILLVTSCEVEGSNDTTPMAVQRAHLSTTPSSPMASTDSNVCCGSGNTEPSESDYETCPSAQATPLASTLATAVPYLQKTTNALDRVKERLNATYSVVISPLAITTAYKRSFENKAETTLLNESNNSQLSPAIDSIDKSFPSVVSDPSPSVVSDPTITTPPPCATPMNSTSSVDNSSDGERTSTVESDSQSIVTTNEKHQIYKQKWAEMMSSAYTKNQHQVVELASDGVKASLLPDRNSPVKAKENHQLRSKRLKEKLAEKTEREAACKRDLKLKKEQERLEKIRIGEERKKRIAGNRAAALKEKEKAKEKLRKIMEAKQAVVKDKKEKEDKNSRVQERQAAAEQRRLEQERLKKQKLKEIEDERRLVEELHLKRLQLEKEERQKKKQERVEVEKERAKRKEELKKQKQQTKHEVKGTATLGNKRPGVPVDNESRKRIRQNWKAIEESFEKESAENRTFVKESLALETVDEEQLQTSTESDDIVQELPATDKVCDMMKQLKECTNNTDNPKTHPVPSKLIKPSKYQDVSTYEITPISKDPLLCADDYGIDDLESDHSTDDEDDPKKAVPLWAAPMNLLSTLQQQDDTNAASIFPPNELLQSPDLAKIFPKLKRRFFKRTSSAHWSSPMLKHYKSSK